VLDASDGREVARLPRYDPLYDDEQPESVPTWAQPVAFASDGRLVLRGYQDGYVWRLPGSSIPFLDGGETTALPIPGSYDDDLQIGAGGEIATLLHGSPEYVSTGSSGDDEGGWWLLPTDPRRWQRELCGRYTDGRVYAGSDLHDEIRRLGDRLCGGG
jgi:hypothetical protein